MLIVTLVARSAARSLYMSIQGQCAHCCLQYHADFFVKNKDIVSVLIPVADTSGYPKRNIIVKIQTT